ncbi:MAG TPA: alpha/beta hydrolase [Woeseiaceae bacterium]|nr:alpha/beta hydrolase [Woeseiaceae bacterium]
MKFVTVNLTILMILLSGCSTLPAAQGITTSAATHTYVLRGSGTPTVVLESGLADGKESWVPIYDAVAQFAQVLAYDRAGYGASRSSNRSRDGATIVRELRATLQALELPPPYVLVGHSIGGTYMELFARTYPDEVAGVVLVDSRHADFTRQCEAAGARSCRPPALLAALLQGAPKRELEDGELTMHEVLRAEPFPDVPLSVLTRGKATKDDELFYSVWLETQKSLAAQTTKSTHTVCELCGHYIHKDNPELVITAVREMVDQVRPGILTGKREL